MIYGAALALLTLSFSWIASVPGSWAAAQEQEEKGKKEKKADEKETKQEDRIKGKGSIAVDVRLVNIECTVTDKKGNLVTGLKAENFTLYEDNVKQEITNFASIEAPITVVLVIDYSKQAYYLGWNYFGNEIWDAMYEFTRTLRKGDWSAVVAYDLRPEILTD